MRQICGPSVPVLLVGCKRDLRDEAAAKGKPIAGHYVEKTHAREVATQIGARSYHECSALKNEGVDAVFEAATRAAMLVRAAAAGGGPAQRGEKSKSSTNEAGACKCVVL